MDGMRGEVLSRVAFAVVLQPVAFAQQIQPVVQQYLFGRNEPMRIAQLTTIVFNLFHGAICLAGSTESLEPSPFSSVVAKGDVIVVTLPKVPRLMVKLPVDQGVARACKESEVFKLAPGSSLELFERHSGYLITPQIQPKPGVNIEFTFDGRSFRRGIVTKKYFVAATEEKKAAEQDGTGQPATRPESKSEGSDKPHPEAEGRSR